MACPLPVRNRTVLINCFNEENGYRLIARKAKVMCLFTGGLFYACAEIVSDRFLMVV
ncbi:MAG: hypothetical protein ACI9H8_000512 [Lysobacterales bacterium]|jgi:hypothetical protein